MRNKGANYDVRWLAINLAILVNRIDSKKKIYFEYFLWPKTDPKTLKIQINKKKQMDWVFDQP